jgi:hypothetical protein
VDKVQFQIYKDQLLQGFREASADQSNQIVIHRNGDAMDEMLIRAMDELHTEGHFKTYVADAVSWHVELA